MTHTDQKGRTIVTNEQIELATLRSQCSMLERTIRGLKDEEKIRIQELRQSKLLVMEKDDEIARLNKELLVALERAITDKLTGLATRAEMEGQMAHHLGILERAEIENPDNVEAAHISVIFCDADGLKDVNDTYGHDAGDAYLRHFAEFMKCFFNRKTDIICRFGGDEFVVILAGVTPKEKAEVIKELFLVALESVSIVLTDDKGESHTVSIRASVGVASTSEGARTVETLLKEADKEMYIHKAARKAAR